jgi:hypothetical protein
MNRAIEARIAKLEAKAPQSPSQFDGMTCDELTVFILEQCAELLACDDTPEEIRADAKREGARISWEITETVNFAAHLHETSRSLAANGDIQARIAEIRMLAWSDHPGLRGKMRKACSFKGMAN